MCQQDGGLTRTTPQRLLFPLSIFPPRCTIKETEAASREPLPLHGSIPKGRFRFPPADPGVRCRNVRKSSPPPKTIPPSVAKNRYTKVHSKQMQKRSHMRARLNKIKQAFCLLPARRRFAAPPAFGRYISQSMRRWAAGCMLGKKKKGKKQASSTSRPCCRGLLLNV